MSVKFYFLSNGITLLNRNTLKLFIRKIFEKEKGPLDSLNFIFCSDKYLLEMNKKFLSHNYFTDVITFDLSETTDSTKGEIYISLDRVKDNAHLLRVSTREELHRVIFHGVLHLCGYKDKSKSDIEAMRAAENKYLKKYFN